MPQADHSAKPSSHALPLPSRPLVVSFILAFSLLTAAHARVFRQWGAASDSNRALITAGGTRAYESEVAINNGKALLTVFSFQLDSSTVVRELQRLFNATTSNAANAATGMLMARADNRVLRFVIVPLELQRQTIVFKLDQSEAEYEESMQPPQKHPLKGVPGHPQSTPTFFARNEDTGLSAAMAVTAATPEAVHAFYRARLLQARWTQLFPIQSGDGSREAPSSSNLSIFSNGADVCYVFTQTGGTPPETRITLLHKQRVLK